MAESNHTTEFRPVLGYEGIYQVSADAVIQRLPGRYRKHLRTLKHSVHPITHQHQVDLSVNNVQKHHLVHRLVAAAFIGPIPEGITINHIDGNRENNHLSNLEFATMHEQMVHALAIGLLVPTRGEDRGRVSKLTNEAVREIRRLHAAGVRAKDLAPRYGVKARAIFHVLARTTWAHV